jgi:hypothetical protein
LPLMKVSSMRFATVVSTATVAVDAAITFASVLLICERPAMAVPPAPIDRMVNMPSISEAVAVEPSAPVSDTAILPVSVVGPMRMRMVGVAAFTPACEQNALKWIVVPTSSSFAAAT